MLHLHGTRKERSFGNRGSTHGLLFTPKADLCGGFRQSLMTSEAMAQSRQLYVIVPSGSCRGRRTY